MEIPKFIWAFVIILGVGALVLLYLTHPNEQSWILKQMSYLLLVFIVIGYFLWNRRKVKS